MSWINNKVSVRSLLLRLRLSTTYTVLRNHNSCKPFVEFISRTIMDRIVVGAVGVIGRVEQHPPPTVVMPNPIRTNEILRFPNDDGFLFNHTWEKTLSGDHSNLFGVCRSANGKICPIAAIERYIDTARSMQVNLTDGFLFRPTTPKGPFQNPQ